MVNIKINGKDIQARDDMTILEAARENNIQIPTLCHLEGIHEMGACRMCVVEVAGAKALQASCIAPVREGMEVCTHSKRVRERRKVLYELILSDHPKDCLNCGRNLSCELQALGDIIQADEARFKGELSSDTVDLSSESIVRDSAKCILCRRCVTMCNEVQQVKILNAQERGFATLIGPGNDLLMGTSTCVNCGQCTTVCPTNALHEKDAIETVWDALADPNKKVVVQTAPAVRVAIGEEFGYPAGTIVTGKMAQALHDLGFDYVFDTNFAADLTIMEEGYELLSRLVGFMVGAGKVTEKQAEELGFKGKLRQPVLPMITSCSPGWIKYIEHYYNGQLGHLSSCKSPHMMLGALVKSYFAEKEKIDPKDMFVVSVMPCTAKKYEITREEMVNGGYPNVDAVLTTRELAVMCKQAGIDLKKLEDGKFDNPLGLSSGAADIFGATGGVMEAALRTVYELLTGREIPFDNLHVEPIKGLEKIKSAAITLEGVKDEWKFLEGVEVKVAVTSGLAGASTLLDQIKKGESPYHFIEVMACPGGCITGGGQPRSDDADVRAKRMNAIYAEDEGKTLRKSHENKDLQQLYKDFLGEPLGHVSHELLHTEYVQRNRY
ncbi:MAG: iron hydrogenase small subunit [Clostridia bacterium]|nr:iron hydrogenase small subunit [Clostridia bacterium]